MDNSRNHLCRELVIANEQGLHARSASKIVDIVQQARSHVWVEKDGNRVDASSILELLTLEAAKGSKIKLTAEAYIDITVLDAISRLIENGFGE